MALAEQKLTLDEFLAWENTQPERNEFYQVESQQFSPQFAQDALCMTWTALAVAADLEPPAQSLECQMFRKTIRKTDSTHQRSAYRHDGLMCDALVRLAFAPVPRRRRARIVP